MRPARLSGSFGARALRHGPCRTLVARQAAPFPSAQPRLPPRCLQRRVECRRGTAAARLRAAASTGGPGSSDGSGQGGGGNSGGGSSGGGSGSGGPGDEQPAGDDGPLVALAELRSKLKPLGTAFQAAVAALWDAQRQWLRHWLARTALAVGVLAASATAGANLWGLPLLNLDVLPTAQAAAAAVLHREVALGAVRWIAPTGLLGLTPLACLGPVSVGRGPVEQSSASVHRLFLCLDLPRSLAQRSVVLAAKAHGVQVDLVQGGNYSWFGYPEDTVPSARDFLPGLGGGGDDGSGGGGTGSEGGSGRSEGGPANSGSGSDGGSGSTGLPPAASGGVPPAAGSGGAARSAASVGTVQHMDALASLSVPVSRQLQQLVERLTRELLAAAGAAGVRPQAAAAGAAAGADAQQLQPVQASEQQQQQQPAVVAVGLKGARSSRPNSQLQQAASAAGQQQDASSTDLLFGVQQRGGDEATADLARAAPGGGGGSGLFGGRLTWGRGPPGAPPQPQPQPEPQPQPGAAPPPPADSRRRQQLAALNGMQLQAGRGFTLQGGSLGSSDGMPASPPGGSEGATAVSPSGDTPTPQYAAGPSGSAAASPAALGAPGSSDASAGNGTIKPAPAGHRSSTPPRSSEQQVERQHKQRWPHEPQHRKLRRRRKGGWAQKLQRQPAGGMEGEVAAAAADMPALGTSAADMPALGTSAANAPALGTPAPGMAALTADAPDAAIAAAVAGSSGGPQRGSTQLGVPMRPPRAPPGTAASLNKQLRPLAGSTGGKLYSAGPAGQSLVGVAARTAEAAAAAGQAAAAGEAAASQQPTEAAAAPAERSAAEAAQAAGQLERAAAAAAAAPPELEAEAAALPAPPAQSMSAQQRRAAVAAINSLPTLCVEMGSRQRRQAEAEASAAASAAAAVAAAEGAAAAAPLVPSPATCALNEVGDVRAPEYMQPQERVRAATAHGGFARMVVDPATLHKKGGSASLPWAHQRPPAASLIGSRLGGRQGDEGDADAAGSGGAAAGAETAAEGLAAGGSAGESAFQPEGGAPGAGASSEAGAAHRRPPLLHPGYFSPAAGPSYTPAPPEALIDARNRRTTLGSLLRGAVEGALSRLHMPEIALGGITVQGGTVDAHVAGEALPRRFTDVSVSLRLGRGYDTLLVDLTALPYKRHPSSAKCTMPSPHAHRHLRHVTGGAEAQTYQEALAAAATGDAAAAAVATAAAEGRDLPPEAGLPVAAVAAYAGGPSGGRLRVRVEAAGIIAGVVPSLGEAVEPGVPVPALDIRVGGEGLHGPLVERLIELPMDIASGQINGELRIRSHDAASWHFPEFYGRLAVRGASFHFWDATDDITDACLDLLFETDRLYFHNATGRFGAVPMSLTGDLDLNPDWGQYRLSAAVPGVEVNALRATLGVRPTPQPVAGAVAGVLHVTGPLEKPVFSGTARGVRPTAAQLAACEQTDALAALLAEPRAVGAYDRVPLAGAGAVFALDTAAETMQLHALHGELLDGGELHGSGRMWVAPLAEHDPSAVRVAAEGRDLAVEAVARRYLPEGVAPPPGMVVGRASLTATMLGSHMAPTLEVALSLPEASASCAVTLRREAARLSLASPHADAAGTVHLAPPSFDAVKAAITQAAATALARPAPTGLDAEVGLRGLDVVPLVSGQVALRQLASGQPVRLKLAGKARVSGTVRQQAVAAAPAAPAEAGGGTPAAPASWQFAGDLGLESVRVNQLRLWQKLAGRLEASGGGVSVHGKGLRANETLDLDLALPLLAPPTQRSPAAAARVAAPPQAAAKQPAAVAEAKPEAVRTPAELEGAEGSSGGAAAAPEPPLAEAPRAGGGRLQLRCGALQVAGDVDAAGSQVNFKVAALKLDELELASLRGDLQEVSCSLNFDSHTGRGKLALLNPRYSGLRGDSLSGGFRWERDVVRLEKLVLQQQRSRYEVQGEYSLPPNTPLPRSASDLAWQSTAGGSSSAATLPGRWRVQVSVPGAELQELLPAARLLQSATSLPPAEYERARTRFLQAIERASLRAADLNTQLRSMAEQLAPAAGEGKGAGGSGRADGTPAPALHLPGLQDIRGQWSGSVQAYGGGSSAASCDFDLRGQSWQWGSYGLDGLLAAGSYHEEEGVQLQEFVLKSGDAKLQVRGSLLGEHQDATVLLTDFPMATLRPIFRAIPALQHAAPAVPAEAPPPLASPRPLGLLTHALGRAARQGLHGEDADSPINGLLYLSGNIAGSKAQPTGELAVRLYDAAVGETRLSQAQASARLSEQQQLTFSVEVVPAEGHRQAGYVKAAGVVPLTEAAAAAAAAPPAPPTPASAAAAAAAQLDVRLSVKDGGMALLTSVTPDLRWQGGQAAVELRLRGSLEQPVLSGTASVAKATLECPAVLRWPLTNVTAEVRAGGGLLTVEGLEARCGRRGTLRLRGTLPVYGPSGGGGSGGRDAPPTYRLAAEASGLELRLRNMYSGQYDASLVLTGSLACPTVGGSMRFSKGIVFIVPQGAPDVAASTAAAVGTDTLLTPSGPGGAGQAGSVARVFDILTRGESGLAQQFEAVMRQEVEAVEHMVEDAGQHNLALDGLTLRLGPDLRAMYPLVMNFGVEGELAVSGPAHPDQVRVRGSVRLPSGDVNLVATQLALDRRHANLITFGADEAGATAAGLDPWVDLVMTGGDVRVAIQGRASEWQDHLSLHYIASRARPDAAGEALEPADAARLFEEKLKAALLAEDGQLALSRLAGTTVSTLMPKIETQGQVGGARWRLVSAPSIPGLLSLDPSLADPSNILSSITMGTEVEIEFGKKLQAAMTRKLAESDVTTQWSLTYKLNSKLRMQFNITSAPPFPKTLLFQFSSEGAAST